MAWDRPHEATKTHLSEGPPNGRSAAEICISSLVRMPDAGESSGAVPSCVVTIQFLLRIRRMGGRGSCRAASRCLNRLSGSFALPHRDFPQQELFSRLKSRRAAAGDWHAS